MRLHPLNWHRPAARAQSSRSTSFFMYRVTSLISCLLIRILFFVFRGARIIAVAVASPDPTVSSVNFSIRCLVPGNSLCHFLGFFLGPCHLRCLTIACALYSPAVWVFHYVLIFSFCHGVLLLDHQISSCKFPVSPMYYRVWIKLNPSTPSCRKTFLHTCHNKRRS